MIEREVFAMDNIFSALARRRTKGVVTEFVLWCLVCFVALMSLIALAMGGGNVVWILLLLTSIGMGVIMAFCLREIAMLYAVCVFNAIIFLIHYLVFAIGYSPYTVAYDYDVSHSAVSIIFFVLALLLSIAVVACAFVQFFSKVRMGTILAILEICNVAAIMLSQIIIYVSEYGGADASYYGINGAHRTWMNYRGYWVGTLALWIMLALTAVFYAFYFWMPLDRAAGKITGGSGSRGGNNWCGNNNWNGNYNYNSQNFQPGMQGLNGAYTGRDIYLQGRTLTVGSSETANVCIPDAQVSRVHCTIRYNAQSGFYEILDQSTNGMFLSDGSRLYPGRYTSVRRGSVVIIGSHRFRLL